MVKKGLIGAFVALVGGYLIGFASGVVIVIDAILGQIPDITASIAGSMTFGLGTSLGRELGNQLYSELWKIVDAELNLKGYMLLGSIIAIIGLWYSNKSGTK